MPEKKKIVVVGGGVTGLAAAYYLNKQVQAENLPYQVVLVEASTRLGGKMQTIHRDGFTIERGPDSWLSSKTALADLASDVGLEDQLTYSKPAKSLICAKNKLFPLPDGVMFGMPTQFMPFMKSGLISPFGKLRVAMEPFISKTKTDDDVAMGPFFRHRFGDELVDNLIEPLIAGLYASDLQKMSALSTFPDFFLHEQKHGSVIKGMRAGIKARATAQTKQPQGEVAESRPKPTGMFGAIASGLDSLATAIEANLSGVEMIKGTKVLEVNRLADDQYKLRLSSGDELLAASVIVSTEHQVIPSMFSDQEFLQFLKEMPSNTMANVTFAYPESAIKQDFDGGSFVVARTSDYNITACSWLHKKWSHVAPDGYALLRAYIGKPGLANEAIVDLSDEELENIALKDLAKHITLEGAPLFTVVSRWKASMPQYTVGHKTRIENMKQQAATELPGIFFASASFAGIGMADCVRQGKEATEKVLAFLSETAE